MEKIIQGLREDLIQSIQDLVAIPSIEDEPSAGMPFGKGVHEALGFTLSLGEKLGFRTFYGDGYYGYIEMGEGEEILGILAHLDTVPVDNPDHWTFPPFGGVIHQNRLYGRGSADDKGPLLGALYAMKAVMEKGTQLNKRVRLILGTNEETNWKGIKKYLEREEIPSLGFVPDSSFPLINAEKGLLQVKLSSSKERVDFRIEGGGALNSVPAICTYKGPKLEDLVNTAESLRQEYRLSQDTISILGRSAHSAKAWEGINPIGKMALILDEVNITSSLLKFIAREIGTDCHGKNIFGSFEDKVSGKITINMGRIFIDHCQQELCLDIRYPVTKTGEEVMEVLSAKAAQYDLKLELLDVLPPLYVPEDHILIRTLREVFEEVTGLDSTPIATGGATYARALKNCVAFGYLFPGKPKVAHEDNEYVDLDDLMKSVLIYARAIERLGSSK